VRARERVDALLLVVVVVVVVVVTVAVTDGWWPRDREWTRTACVVVAATKISCTAGNDTDRLVTKRATKQARVGQRSSRPKIVPPNKPTPERLLVALWCCCCWCR
jgi:hypothetical protein